MLLVLLQAGAASGAAQPVPDHVQRLLRLPCHHLVLVARRRFQRILVLPWLLRLIEATQAMNGGRWQRVECWGRTL